MIRDAIGNRIEKGQILQWHLNPLIKERGLIATVVDIMEPSIVSSRDGESSEPILVLQLRLPVQTDPRQKDVILHDMLRVVNPAQEAVIEAAMGKMQ